MSQDKKLADHEIYRVPRDEETVSDWMANALAYPGRTEIPVVLFEVDPRKDRILAAEENLGTLDYFGEERWNNEIYPYLVDLFERFYHPREDDNAHTLADKFNEFFSTKGFGNRLEDMARPESRLLRARALVTEELILVLRSDVEIHRPRLYYPDLTERFKGRYLRERIKPFS